ncbi:MAG: beta-N-acetylhexosaminidase [Bacteroidaceae bacterium]|nr:beta-N-acetylhexosaminidase [Bacteroidaceae bacterium]
MKKTFLFFFLCLFAFTAMAQEISLIPKPAEMHVGEGKFLFNGKIVICYPEYSDKEIEKVLDNFVEELEETTDVKLKKSTAKKEKLQNWEVTKFSKKGDAHILIYVDESMADEEYKLSVTAKRIDITAAKPAGLFYAFQTLKQLMPRNVMAGVRDESINEWSVPCVFIVDKPRFSWRGFMLDEGRHFYGKEEIKKIIDVMAAYKMNRFHWHLTEDQGWRIEINKYPKLTKVGAWRDSKVCAWGDVKPDGIRYGGYYTRKDIKEVVKYAKERFIEIVPEVDIPGHSQAAVASYPEFLSCDPQNPHEVWLWQGVSNDVINVANPKAVQFAKDVIDELIEMFPFGYIHLGGDECPTYKWEHNAECQALLKQIGSDKYRDLQIHFYKQLKDHVAAKPADKQRKLIFWNEVLHGNTAPLGEDITIMAWIGADGAAKDAAMRGMNTILSPQIPYYINRKQSNLPAEPHSQGYGDETVERVYNYKPMNNIPAELQPKYMGVQANFWTEWVVEPWVVEYLMFPRLAAVAEAGWTPAEKRDYNDFLNRLQGEAKYYNLRGVSYGKHVFK